MTKLRLVHVSDIHFGQEKLGTKIEHDETRRKLIEDAAEMSAKLGPAHMVLAIGDIAYSGKKEEYDVAGAWLDQLTEASKCAVTDVRVVPGNHDCDLSELNRLTATFHRAIRSNDVSSAYADLDDMAKGAEEANQILPKFRAYRDFASGYRSDFQSAARPFWTREFDIADGVKLRFIGLNSVQISDRNDALGLMLLGNSQYVLPDERNIINIVAMHHPLDWFMDRAEAKPYLRSRAKVMMFGHEHLANITKSSDLSENEWLDIFSGATNSPDRNDEYQHAYNWLEFDVETQGESHSLRLTVYPRIWSRGSTRFDVDRNRIGGRDSATFSINCPRLIPQTEEPGKEGLPITSQATSMKFSEEPRMTHSPTDIERGMDQLCFLFWRYLDWQQRLKVLVDADVLPKNADRPLPQTMERLALETARKDGKLADVWTAMMGLLPSNKQQNNPFV